MIDPEPTGRPKSLLELHVARIDALMDDRKRLADALVAIMERVPLKGFAGEHAPTCQMCWEIARRALADEPWLCQRAEAMRATLADFADPDHWIQNDDGEWVWYGAYPPFERPALDLLGSLGQSTQRS